MQLDALGAQYTKTRRYLPRQHEHMLKIVLQGFDLRYATLSFLFGT